jgi:hypothetical protein
MRCSLISVPELFDEWALCLADRAMFLLSGDNQFFQPKGSATDFHAELINDVSVTNVAVDICCFNCIVLSKLIKEQSFGPVFERYSI